MHHGCGGGRRGDDREYDHSVSNYGRSRTLTKILRPRCVSIYVGKKFSTRRQLLGLKRPRTCRRATLIAVHKGGKGHAGSCGGATGMQCTHRNADAGRRLEAWACRRAREEKTPAQQQPEAGRGVSARPARKRNAGGWRGMRLCSRLSKPRCWDARAVVVHGGGTPGD